MGVASITICDQRMRQLILPGASLECLYQGTLWAEGPAYFTAGDYLLWSDIPNNRVMQWVPDLGVRVYSHQSNYSNGNSIDGQGRRIVCEHLTRSVVRFEHDGSQTLLASHYNGKRLNSPNDVVVSSDGAIWFTDPSYGIMSDYEGKRAEPEQPGCYVYRICPNTGNVEAKVITMNKPNGLAFSPDEKTLYVADSSRSHDEKGFHHVLAFPIGNDGVIGKEHTIAVIENGVPDGLRVDEFGNLWISSARGVEVFSNDGVLLGVLHIPETVANLTFGGPKNNRLFITATTSLYAIYLAVSGTKYSRKSGCLSQK